MPAPDADVPAETPAGTCPSLRRSLGKDFLMSETAVRTQGALRGPLPSGAAAGEWAASSSGHPSRLVPPRAHAASSADKNGTNEHTRQGGQPSDPAASRP